MTRKPSAFLVSFFALCMGVALATGLQQPAQAMLLSQSATDAQDKSDKDVEQATVQAIQEKDEDDGSIPSIAKATKGLERTAGYFSFYWDPRKGKIWLEIPRLNEEFLYVESLATGLGSNPVGLDRGQLGGEHVVQFERVGPKILLKQRNLRFRALSNDPLERRAVRQSFAESILWGTTVEAETDGAVLVDATEFLMRDAHDVIGTLRQADQGNFSLDQSRSAMYLPRCKAFPDNTEFEATLTFSSRDPGRHVRQTSPTPQAVTLRQHHSFIKLPDGDYTPRKFDPRNSSFGISFADYATPIDQPLEKRWISRHRLKKKNPNAAVSEAIEPIIYYVDPGAPEPIRQALIDGASWWNEAFEAAGFQNAFQVRVLPGDADPMDVRYNVIQWVHRSTRGWSYGGSVTDPRTGEIIKGHVTLGSLRVRQDRTLFEGLQGLANSNAMGQSSHLLNPLTATGHFRASAPCRCCGLGAIPEESYLAELDSQLQPVDVALARIRQLSAHEVGHTLGFAHNFAASTYADRASVMDYPAPRVKITASGDFDLSDAYGVGIGAWDKFSVQYAYSQFAPGANEDAELEKLVQSGLKQGLLYISDGDARPAGAAHPLANLWDDGTDPVAALRHEMRVRRIALDRFSVKNLPEGQALSELELTLVPVYLHHRYQVDATAKMLGGAEYTYAVHGDGQTPITPIPAGRQQAALDALLATLDPAELLIDPEVTKNIPPAPYSLLNDQERFPGQRGLMFDPLAAARVAANMTLGNVLQPQRATRLVAQGQSSQSGTSPPDLHKVIETLIDTIWVNAPSNGAEQAVNRVVRDALVRQLMSLASATRVPPEVRAEAEAGLKRVQSLASILAGGIVTGSGTNGTELDKRFAVTTVREIERFFARPHDTATPPASISTPPGSPIGQ
ncbi:MAG: zinc-dependent metalloprotease [Pirellulales bacterium]|nr:zinc-dependent metalloprotease [Pirellulales bacterium]